MNTNKITNGVEGLSKLVSPKFGPGMLLEHDDLQQIVKYTSELSRLLFRSLFGCGVICGLEVSPPKIDCGKIKVTVQPGVALSGSGDPIEVPEKVDIYLNESEWTQKDIWIVLCRTQWNCSPRKSMCSPDGDDSAPIRTRINEGFRITAENAVDKDCVCGCFDGVEECFAAHNYGHCECGRESNCVVLAKLSWQKDSKNHKVEKNVRRFIRPKLPPEPNCKKEENDLEAGTDGGSGNQNDGSTNGGSDTSGQAAPTTTLSESITSPVPPVTQTETAEDVSTGELAEAPVAEAPVAEAPVAEAPVAEAPVAEGQGATPESSPVPAPVEEPSGIQEEAALAEDSSAVDSPQFEDPGLQAIEGIGESTERFLKSQGIETFAQLAEKTPAEIKEILSSSSNNSIAIRNPQTWPLQARMGIELGLPALESWQHVLHRGEISNGDE